MSNSRDFSSVKASRDIQGYTSTEKLKQNTQSWSIMGESFNLDTRYKVIDYLGEGAYGVVAAAEDSVLNSIVAIKKCKKIFQSRTLAKRTLRELRLLRLFNHENIVRIKSVLLPEDLDTFAEIYCVFEIMETDLAQIIRSPQTLKDQHVQYFTYQLLLAMTYLHAANIVHRDLKPRNLLVNSDCCLKVADFGLARIYDNSNDSKIVAMTEYVTTRWYRAPEVLVGWHRYTSAVDMWAVGCIVAELIGRMPLFPGENSLKQLDLLCRFSGKPSEEFIKQSRKASCRQYLNDLPPYMRPTDVRNLYPGANPQALDLVKRLLDFNPLTRLTAEEALHHPYIKPMVLRNATVLRSRANLSYNPNEFLFEGLKPSIDDLRAELLHEVNCYHPDAMPPQHHTTLPKVNDVLVVNGGGHEAVGGEALHTLATAAAIASEIKTKEEEDGEKSMPEAAPGVRAMVSMKSSDKQLNSSLGHTDSIISSGDQSREKQDAGNKRGRLSTPNNLSTIMSVTMNNGSCSSLSDVSADKMKVDKLKILAEVSGFEDDVDEEGMTSNTKSSGTSVGGMVDEDDFTVRKRSTSDGGNMFFCMGRGDDLTTTDNAHPINEKGHVEVVNKVHSRGRKNQNFGSGSSQGSSGKKNGDQCIIS